MLDRGQSFPLYWHIVAFGDYGTSGFGWSKTETKHTDLCCTSSKAHVYLGGPAHVCDMFVPHHHMCKFLEYKYKQPCLSLISSCLSTPALPP